MEWLRLYHDARTDAKLAALTDAQYRVWTNLLIFSSEQAQRGNVLGLTDRLLAVEVSRGDVDLLRDSLAVFEELRLVCRLDGGWKVANFEKRQYQSDTSTERTRRYRGKGTGDVPVTSPTGTGDGGVTPPDTDTETDAEAEGEGVTPLPPDGPALDEPDYESEFKPVYSEYPKHVEPGAALRAFTARRREGRSADELMTAARNYAEWCRRKPQPMKYRKQPATFFGRDRPFLEWVAGIPPDKMADLEVQGHGRDGAVGGGPSQTRRGRASEYDDLVERDP